MFRFTIRDVLWLTVVIAMGVGWWIEHRRLTYDNLLLREEVWLYRYHMPRQEDGSSRAH
jgi:hypothetical protein